MTVDSLELVLVSVIVIRKLLRDGTNMDEECVWFVVSQRVR